MEMPLPSRTPPVTSLTTNPQKEFVENSSAVTKGNPNLLETSAVDGDCDHQVKESECAGSVGEDFDEDEEQVSSPLKVRMVHKGQGNRRTGNYSNRKKAFRKRRVTANLSGTKYDIGKTNFRILSVHVDSYGDRDTTAYDSQDSYMYMRC